MPTQGRFKDTEQWPEPERSLWPMSTRPRRRPTLDGEVAPRRDSTLSKVRRGYAHGLCWLDETCQLESAPTPEVRWTDERVKAYAAYMEQHVELTTVGSRLTDLQRAIVYMSPNADVAHIRKLSYRYPSKGDSLKKHARMQDPGAVLQLGHELMGEARRASAPTRRHAGKFRDGLLIALLVMRALRLKNLASISLGTQLVPKDTGAWWLNFAAHEMKAGTPYTANWPESLSASLDEYLSRWRPMLMKGTEGSELWISERLGGMTENGIYYMIIARTKARFGQSINPHLFRDALATSIAVHDPANVRVVPAALQHNSHKTAETFYNQAKAIDASRRMNSATERLRERLRKK